MINKIKKMLSSAFVKQVFTLSAGTAVAQAIPVIISPILTRIYTPSQIGIYSLFISSVNLTVQFSCLKYDMAITASQDDSDSTDLFFISCMLSLASSFLLIFLLPFSSRLSFLFKADNSLWLYYLPVSTLFTGVFSALTSFNIRCNCYKDIATANIIRSLVMGAVQIFSVVIFSNAAGLIIGQAASYLAGNIKLFKNIFFKIKNYKPDYKKIINTAKKYGSYPKYTVIGSLANTGVFNAISFFLAYFYNTKQLGYYSMVNRALGIPLTIISTAISQVYFNRETKNINNTQKLFSRITLMLALISIPIFIIIYFAAKPAAVLFLGDEWADAGSYIKILVPLFAVRFIVSPVSTAAIAKGKQLQTTVWQLLLLAISVIPALINMFFAISIEIYLMIISLGLSISYIVFYLYCKGLVK